MSIIDEKEAVKRLLLHDVVALPTETVYGLAAMVNNDQGLRKIFETKARPFFDPLIVHVENKEQAQSLAFWDEVSLELAQKFWPGPLTIVLPKKETVSDLITSGGSTVAIRCPNHPAFLKVLSMIPAPLAAPSANRFGRTSPTCAEHVIYEFSGKVAVVDGGDCETGIESSVVEYDISQKILKILRPGAIGKKDFENLFLEKKRDIKVTVKDQQNAPGFLKNHYQPSVSLYLVFQASEEVAPKELMETMSANGQVAPVQWQLPDEPRMAARFLYRDLHEFSKKQQPIFLMIKEKWLEDEMWQSLLDRLNKAAHFFVRSAKGQWQLTAKNNSLQ